MHRVQYRVQFEQLSIENDTLACRCAAFRGFRQHGNHLAKSGCYANWLRTYHVFMNCSRIGFLLVTLGVLSARHGVPQQISTGTFASPDGMFRFNYSRALVSCSRNLNQIDRWLPDDPCNAYAPVCSNLFGDSTGTVACIAYPASEMKGSNFEAAAFSVSELKQTRTEAECLKVEDPAPYVEHPRYETVNGVKFKVTETDGVAAGNLIDAYVYRAFHRRKCYELDIRIAYWNAANADPDTVKTFDVKSVYYRLKEVLDTFKFIH